MTITTTHHSWCSEHLTGEDVDQCVSAPVGDASSASAWLFAAQGDPVQVAFDSPPMGGVTVTEAHAFAVALSALLERVAS